MKKIFAAIAIVVAMAWNATVLFAAQRPKSKVPYSITSFRLALQKGSSMRKEWTWSSFNIPTD
jgi:hypothetical protein